MQRNWYGHGVAIERTWEERMRLLAALIAGAALYLTILLPAGYSLLLSLKMIDSSGSLTGAPFVGLANYTDAFATPFMPRIVGHTLLLGLVTGLFTCVLVTGTYFSLRRIPDARLRFGLAGITFLPWMLPVTDIPNSLLAFFPSASSGVAQLFLCALCQAALAVPFMLTAFLALEQVAGGLGLPVVVLAAFGLGWYAGVGNYAVQNTMALGNPANTTIWLFAYHRGDHTSDLGASLIRIAAQGAIAKLGLFALIPLAAALFRGEVSPTDREKLIFTKQPFYMYLPALPAALVAIGTVGVVFSVFAGVEAGPPPVAGNYLASYIRLLSPVLGLALGGTMAYSMEGRRDMDKFLISLGVVFALSEMGRYNIPQYFFREWTDTANTFLPPLDTHWAAVAGFAVMAICLPYWRGKNCDNVLTRCVFLLGSACILIGVTHMNDPTQARLIVSVAEWQPLSAIHHTLNLIPMTINFALLAGGVLLLGQGMHRVDVVSSLKG